MQSAYQEKLPLDANDKMARALAQAQLARVADEVPVGACIFDEKNTLIASSFNQTIKDHDPSAHAEINCLRQASQKLNNHRLLGCVMYVTLEPCAMCVGAIWHARLGQVFFGAFDPKTGACGSAIDLAQDKRFNHQTKFKGGIMEEECSKILRDFFSERRCKKL